MSTPTPILLAGLRCVTADYRGRIASIEIQSLADVRALADWCSMPMTHAATRRRVLDAVVEWAEWRERQLAHERQEQRDREAGCVALLLDAAQRVGEASRGA